MRVVSMHKYLLAKSKRIRWDWDHLSFMQLFILH